MGQAGRKIYEERFTAGRMAQASLALYRRALERHRQLASAKSIHA
jgi:hypothetical protein